MASFQTIVEELMLTTGASRALLQLARPDGSFAYAAEAVRHGARQVRNDAPGSDGITPRILKILKPEDNILVDGNLGQSNNPVASAIAEEHGAKALMLSGLFQGDRLVGVLSLNDTQNAKEWDNAQLKAVSEARDLLIAKLKDQDADPLATKAEKLKNSALQGILDDLRIALGVQRCTLRQNVSEAYAFPVTHESRSEGTWSLLGDFTIIQTGQPVIQKMLTERTQVVQDDTRNASTDPLFHVMLKHYGDMRAQIVTPLFVGDTLTAVLSIHNLKELRTWTPAEMQLGQFATRLIGAVIGTKP